MWPSIMITPMLFRNGLSYHRTRNTRAQVRFCGHSHPTMYVATCMGTWKEHLQVHIYKLLHYVPVRVAVYSSVSVS